MKKVTVKDLDKRIGGLEAKIDKLVDAIPSVKVSDIEKCLKQELEVGKWYYATEDEYKWLFNYVELNKEHGRYCGYGFDLEYKDDIIWNEQMSFQTENECKFSPATDKEVEEALIKEAKKRGFKEGAWFNCIDSKIKRKFAPYSKLDAHVELTYKPNNTLCHYNGLTTEYGGCSNPDIFRDGKWAEIVEQEDGLAVGKWYKNKGGAIAFKEQEHKCYGFSDHGEWYRSADWIDSGASGKWDLATEEEVEAALVKEAKKRGLKDGATIDQSEMKMKGTWGRSSRITGSYAEMHKGKLIIGHRYVFNEGNWAEVQGDKPIILNGKEVVISEGGLLQNKTITIGCMEIGLGIFEDTITVLDDEGIDTIHHPELGDIKVSDLKALIQ